MTPLPGQIVVLYNIVCVCTHSDQERTEYKPIVSKRFSPLAEKCFSREGSGFLFLKFEDRVIIYDHTKHSSSLPDKRFMRWYQSMCVSRKNWYPNLDLFVSFPE